MHMESTLGGTFIPQDNLAEGNGEATRGSTRGGGIEPVEANPLHEANQLHGQVTSVLAENRELRAELEVLRAEKARMHEILSRLAEVLGSKSADRLVHDVRNVLNERELYRALADSAM